MFSGRAHNNLSQRWNQIENHLKDFGTFHRSNSQDDVSVNAIIKFLWRSVDYPI